MADYPISNVPRRVVYAPSGVGPYAFTFEILNQTDIAVYLGNNLLTLTTGYTVTINANGTGSVTLTATAGTSNVTIIGARAIQRSSDYTTGGDLFASTLNVDLDSQTIFSQQIAETAERSLKSAITDSTSLNMSLPTSQIRSNKLLGFSNSGEPIASSTTVAQVDAAVQSFVNATGNNAASIIYNPAGTGAVAATVQSKLRETVSVKDFGAVGNGVTDDTAAIQAAIDYLSPLGGTLHIPKGAYIVSDANSDNACLVVTAPIQFVGDGAFYTSIQPAAGVAGTVNTILVNPNPSFDQTLMSFRNLSLGNLNNGTRQGNHGIYCLTLNAGQNLPKFTVENCAIQQGGGFAIYHLNDLVDNVNGGMYACYINNNALKGGIKFENSGDSLVVSNNVLSGTGTGVEASLTTGASLLSILDNNITTSNSAIIINSGMRVHILRNNIEHYTTGSNNNNVISILSTGGTYVAGTIQQNLVSAFGATDATKLISIAEARGTLIQDNTFLAGVGGITAINITSTCTDIRVGANTYNATIATKINDSGNGTMGVVKTPTLLNSWVTNSATEIPTFYKDLSGTVFINGVVKSGTTTFGTAIFQLPGGFRPANNILSSQFSNNGTSNIPAYIGVDGDGKVYVGQAGNTVLTMPTVFRASNAADAISPE